MKTKTHHHYHQNWIKTTKPLVCTFQHELSAASLQLRNEENIFKSCGAREMVRLDINMLPQKFL